MIPDANSFPSKVSLCRVQDMRSRPLFQSHIKRSWRNWANIVARTTCVATMAVMFSFVALYFGGM